MEADIGHKHPQFTMINGAIATVRLIIIREILFLKEGSHIT